MSYNLTTGRVGLYRECFAQLGYVGLMVNGHDANKIIDLRTGQVKTLGLAAANAPTQGSSPGAGLVDGSVRYRVRWFDSSTRTMSPPGAELSATVALITVRVTQPSSPDSRADFWIVERTTDGGRVWYPVNVNSGSPNGTAIGTTFYDDNVSDSTLRNRQGYDEKQNAPPRSQWCFQAGNRLWMGGGRVHTPNVTATNGSAAVSSTDGKFPSDIVTQNEYLAMDGDTDGKTYRISARADADNLTLAENYAGSTKTLQPAKIAGKRNRAYWCEPNRPEEWGPALLSGAAGNFQEYGAEALVGGVYLGAGAGVLLCTDTQMWQHSYLLDPNKAPVGDGRIVPKQARRGLLSFASIKRVEGMVYGMDVRGPWVLPEPGAEPADLGRAIYHDWQGLNFSAREQFFIGYDALENVVLFFVCTAGEAYPKRAYVWGMDEQDWLGTMEFPYGLTCAFELPDGNGAYRCAVFKTIEGSEPSYPFVLNVGTNLGAPPATSNLTGTVTGGSGTTLAKTSAGWPTTGEKLKSLPVKLVRAADGSEETKLASDNTADTLTVNAWSGTAPVAGDTYIIAGIESAWRTARLDAGDPTRKKLWQYAILELLDDTNQVPLKFRVYLNGAATPITFPEALSLDGVAITAGKTYGTITPAAGRSRYRIPLNGSHAKDIQLEFFSDRPGTAWQVQSLALRYEMDKSEAPAMDS